MAESRMLPKIENRVEFYFVKVFKAGYGTVVYELVFLKLSILLPNYSNNYYNMTDHIQLFIKIITIYAEDRKMINY